jgi:hypothetical protein
MPHQMLIEEVVRDRGSDELFSVPASATVGDAVDADVHEIGAVLVMTEDGLVGGIFTERDADAASCGPSLEPEHTPISL